MSYQVLARKWRPQTFEEMAGQAPVLRALVNALNQQRLHHAYLFTGTRGVGKTTVARILAKCLNCETGISATPCGQCGHCLAISQGHFVDLIEVDAASRTKVEDTRALLDNVAYVPTSGRFKIYLIDEVHMLSGHSFNALLKTLEEPPEHVKFLLATTDPERLPATVISRCLQFHLGALSTQVIANYLQWVLEQEQCTFEVSALNVLARAARGSMRDGLSLLDQAIAYGQGHISEQEVNALLGTTQTANVWALITALLEGNGTTVFANIAHMAEQAVDFSSILDQLLSHLQQIAVFQIVPDAVSGEQSAISQIQALSQKAPGELIQLYYQIALIGKRDLALAPDPREGFEMVLLRMLAFFPGQQIKAMPENSDRSKPATTAPKAPVSGEANDVQAAAQPTVGAPYHSDQDKLSEAKQRGETQGNGKPPTQGSTREGLIENHQAWLQLVCQLNLNGVASALAQHCVFKSATNRHIQLTLAPKHAPLLSPAQVSYIERALRAQLRCTCQLSIELADSEAQTLADQQAKAREQRQQNAIIAINNDANVQAMVDTFAAKVEPDSVVPCDAS